MNHDDSSSDEDSLAPSLQEMLDAIEAKAKASLCKDCAGQARATVDKAQEQPRCAISETVKRGRKRKAPQRFKPC